MPEEFLGANPESPQVDRTDADVLDASSAREKGKAVERR
jgi:hypothetical protein